MAETLLVTNEDVAPYSEGELVGGKKLTDWRSMMYNNAHLEGAL